MTFSSSVSDDEMRQLSRGDKSSVLKICQKNGLALRHAPERWRSQREVVCVAVADNYRALEFASQTMKDTEEVVRTAVITDGWAFRFASKRLRRDRAFCNEMKSLSPSAWTFCDDIEELPFSSTSIARETPSCSFMTSSATINSSLLVEQAHQNSALARACNLPSLRKRFGSAI